MIRSFPFTHMLCFAGKAFLHAAGDERGLDSTEVRKTSSNCTSGTDYNIAQQKVVLLNVNSCMTEFQFTTSMVQIHLTDPRNSLQFVRGAYQSQNLSPHAINGLTCAFLGLRWQNPSICNDNILGESSADVHYADT